MKRHLVPKRLILALGWMLTLGTTQAVSGQRADHQIPQTKGPDSTASALWFDIDATTFFRDAEFFLPYTKGYTACGFRLSPSLRYEINDRAFIRGGVMLTGIAGTDGIWKAEPILTIGYRPFQWLQLNMGTIEGSLSHKMGEPLYNRERWVYDYKEDGIQILTHTRHWESDTWLDWEHFLEPWTPDQESFSLGTRQVLKWGNKHLHIELPLCFLGAHRGGQFSTLDTCIETIFNGSAGLTLGYKSERFDLYAHTPVYFYKKATAAPERHLPFDDGWGFYPQITSRLNLKIVEIHIGLGYWYGHQFIASRGSHLFQSTSWFDPDFSQAERHLTTVDIGLSHEYKGLNVDLNAQFYYDPDHKKLDLGVGLIMGFKTAKRIL